jgi:hypothetical protein
VRHDSDDAVKKLRNAARAKGDAATEHEANRALAGDDLALARLAAKAAAASAGDEITPTEARAIALEALLSVVRSLCATTEAHFAFTLAGKDKYVRVLLDLCTSVDLVEVAGLVVLVDPAKCGHANRNRTGHLLAFCTDCRSTVKLCEACNGRGQRRVGTPERTRDVPCVACLGGVVRG